MHHPTNKPEDFTVFGGDNLTAKLSVSKGLDGIDCAAPIDVPCDGVMRSLDAGSCLTGAVPIVNNDRTDTVFEKLIVRFANIEENEPVLDVLVLDYF